MSNTDYAPHSGKPAEEGEVFATLIYAVRRLLFTDRVGSAIVFGILFGALANGIEGFLAGIGLALFLQS